MIEQKPARTQISSALAKEKILAAVDNLFYTQGSRAVGVDAVAKQAGINKMALYRQFSSKDALLLEYLKQRDQQYWQRFESSLSQHPGLPAKQLQQIFTDFVQRASTVGYRGCPFVNIALEYPDPQHMARQAVAQNKHRLHAKLKQLATEAGAANPAALAASLALLFEGACAASQTYADDPALIKAVPSVAQHLIASHLA